MNRLSRASTITTGQPSSYLPPNRRCRICRGNTAKTAMNGSWITSTMAMPCQVLAITPRVLPVLCMREASGRRTMLAAWFRLVTNIVRLRATP
ncbi:MAG: hypothetical protein AO395_04495 [Candidatus Fermentibacter daniensis]|nr:MAG: hypothetical protein AO395_04495 [Candidatus Fermentibacter daniensis]